MAGEIDSTRFPERLAANPPLLEVFRIYRRRFLTLFFISLIGLGPLIVVDLFTLPFLDLSIFLLILGIVSALILAPAATSFVVDAYYLDRRVGPLSSYLKASGKFFHLFGATVIFYSVPFFCSVLIFVMLSLFGFFASAILPLLVSLLIFLVFLFWFVVLVSWLFYVQVIMI